MKITKANFPKLALGAFGATLIGLVIYTKIDQATNPYYSAENQAIRKNYSRTSAYVLSGEEFSNEMGQTCKFFNQDRSTLVCGDELSEYQQRSVQEGSEAMANARARIFQRTVDSLYKKGCYYDEATRKFKGAWNC